MATQEITLEALIEGLEDTVDEWEGVKGTFMAGRGRYTVTSNDSIDLTPNGPVGNYVDVKIEGADSLPVCLLATYAHNEIDPKAAHGLWAMPLTADARAFANDVIQGVDSKKGWRGALNLALKKWGLL